ncbi:MAG: indole-3-glycerol phosphate synthase TrpC [Chloroflexi bacterium]|nr:indole-3-glycerol phosphate synthase TrpC [Chloroflexota bacterium]
MILDDIVTRRRADLEKTRGMPERVLRRIIGSQPPARDFAGALRRSGIQIIAEIKRASPVKGPLREELDPQQFAQMYEARGAAAVSVLTEPHFFHGSLTDLRHARLACGLPVLRKDFIVDAFQILEARANEADAVLLIAAVLDDRELAHLRAVAFSVGLEALVEVHTREEAQRALDAGATVIGINNRNLYDFTVDLRTTEEIAGYLPHDVTLVSESGIRSAEDVYLLRQWGVHAILVGESLVTSPDPGTKLAELVSAGRFDRVAH